MVSSNSVYPSPADAGDGVGPGSLLRGRLLRARASRPVQGCVGGEGRRGRAHRWRNGSTRSDGHRGQQRKRQPVARRRRAATYVVVEDGRVEHRRVAYEVERVAAELAAMDHPDAETYAARLRTGTWTPPSPP